MIDPAEQTAFEDFALRWKAIHAEGDLNDWLRWDGDEQCLDSPQAQEARRVEKEERAAWAASIRAEEAERARKDKAMKDGIEKLRRHIYHQDETPATK